MLPIQLYSFVVIVAWISFICAIIINFMELIMVITDIDSVFIGLTMLACGNSIGGTPFPKKIIIQSRHLHKRERV